MIILILSAFPEEQHYYRKTMNIVSEEKISFVNVTKGQIGSATIYLATTGMGTINAAAVLATLAAHLKPDAVFFSGTSGGIDPTLNIGDVVVAESAFDIDILAVHTKVIGTQFESALIDPNVHEKTPEIYVANPILLEASRSSTLHRYGIFHGRIATSNHFPSPKELFAEIKTKNSLIIDMESVAIYQFGWLSKLPVLVVRGISNTLDHQGDDVNIATANISSSDHAAELVLECIQTIIRENSLAATI